MKNSYNKNEALSQKRIVSFLLHTEGNSAGCIMWLTELVYKNDQKCQHLPSSTFCHKLKMFITTLLCTNVPITNAYIN